jgi:hypothetical protein
LFSDQYLMSFYEASLRVYLIRMLSPWTTNEVD